MPALGAVFALLAALSLSSEAAELRKADQDVAAEAAAASRLAWASTTPGVDTEAVQDDAARLPAGDPRRGVVGDDGGGDPRRPRGAGRPRADGARGGGRQRAAAAPRPASCSAPSTR